jgi:hypothetical protein
LQQKQKENIPDVHESHAVAVIVYKHVFDWRREILHPGWVK